MPKAAVAFGTPRVEQQVYRPHPVCPRLGVCRLFCCRLGLGRSPLTGHNELTPCGRVMLSVTRCGWQTGKHTSLASAPQLRLSCFHMHERTTSAWPNGPRTRASSRRTSTMAARHRRWSSALGTAAAHLIRVSAIWALPGTCRAARPCEPTADSLRPHSRRACRLRVRLHSKPEWPVSSPLRLCRLHWRSYRLRLLAAVARGTRQVPPIAREWRGCGE